MKNTNFPQNNKASTLSVNRIISTPEQSPIIIPANVETPMILRGSVEVVSGEQIFEYTNVDAGEFTVKPVDLKGSIAYILDPGSAEGNINVLLYSNDRVYQQYPHYVEHTGSTPEVGTILFFIPRGITGNVLKIVVFTEIENIIFADAINSDGVVTRPALTMEIVDD